MRALQNFPISGRTAHPSLIRAYLWIKAAAARANSELGALPKEVGELITQAVKEVIIIQSEWNNYFPIDPYQAGAGTSQNMNVNEVPRECCKSHPWKSLGTYSPVHPNDHVNRSQSTNDTFPTAMRLAILCDSKDLVEELTRLSKTLSVLEKKWDPLAKSGRTHLQDAVPIRLGQEFRAYARYRREKRPMDRGGPRSAARARHRGQRRGYRRECPAGIPLQNGPALEQLSGEKLRLAPDLIEAMQSQSPVTFYSSMLRMAALELTRICNDLRLMASGPADRPRRATASGRRSPAAASCPVRSTLRSLKWRTRPGFPF